VALLVGTEAEGLGAAARAAADVAVRIAMAPGADSLNLATASGIALHHLAVRLSLGDLPVPPRGAR
jgi:tRNA G18 (ribose-2'-O)-methylase SpoU